jgi:hypothetical protein
MLDPVPTKTYERVGRREINAHARHNGEGVLLPSSQEEAANQGLHHVRQALVRQQSVISAKKKYGAMISNVVFVLINTSSVADPDPKPPDPCDFGPPGSGSTSHRYGSGSLSLYYEAKIVRKTLIPAVL